MGSYLTRELFEAGFHLKLLIRNSAHVQAKERISEVFPSIVSTESVFDTLSGRIDIIAGNVSQEYLGLNVKDYSRLSETVDEVFHCAAATKFYEGPDNTLDYTNVNGTKHIGRFCLSNKPKRFHYISTAYVAGTRRDTVFEHELEKRQTFRNNYEKSKFDAERILIQFTSQHNIPTTIYRPSIIVGDSKNGFIHNYDNIYIFGKGLSHLRNYETRNNPKENRFHGGNGIGNSASLRIPGDKHGTINLVPVDYVTQAIIAISGQTNSINKTFHIVNPSPPTLGELAEWMAVAMGFHRIKIVPLYEFQILPHTVQEKLFLQGTDSFQPYMFGESYFDSTNTRNLLSGTSIECPLITQELISRFIQYAENTNWGKKNQIEKNNFTQTR